MTKKKSSILLLIMALLALAGGVCANYFFPSISSSDENFLKQNFYILLLAIIPSSVVLVGLWIYNKVLRLLEFPKENANPFIYLGAVLYIGSMIAFGFMNGNTIHRFVITPNELGFILFAFTIACLLIELFIIDVNDKKKTILFDDYKLYFRHWNWINKDNLPVTIKDKHNKLLAPEVYFENEDFKKIYETHLKYVWTIAEQEAKKAIFENEFEYETNGEWYISRIDFLEGDGFSYPQLILYMTFITKNIKSYRLYGLVELSKRVIESDYCRIACVFDYRRDNAEIPFSFIETEVELIFHYS